MSTWDNDYIDLVEPGFVTFAARTMGEMAFGVVTAALFCAFDKSKSDVSFDFTGFDEGDEVSGNDSVELVFEPGLAGHLHIRALLFGGVRGLFLYVMPRLSKKRQIVVRPKRSACTSIRFACSSLSVTSGDAATSARMNLACASMRRDLRSPPAGLAPKCPPPCAGTSGSHSSG